MKPTGQQTGYGLPPIGTAEILESLDEGTEFGLPDGLDVPGYEDKPPIEGGRYKPKAPQCDLNIGVGHRI